MGQAKILQGEQYFSKIITATPSQYMFSLQYEEIFFTSTTNLVSKLETVSE